MRKESAGQEKANKARAAYERGLEANEKGDKNQAIVYLTQAIKIDPNDATAYSNRGLSYHHLGDLKNAAKDAKKAHELGDGNVLQYLEKKKLIRD